MGGIGILPGKNKTNVSPDGIYNPRTHEWIKIRGKSWMPDNKVCIENGIVLCTGGPCKLMPPYLYDPGTRADWMIPDGILSLPDIEPLPSRKK